MIPPLSDAERIDLERSICAYGGAREPIDVWQGLIVDGHNRYAICKEHGLPFTTRAVAFADRDAVKAWMFEHQIARRNLSEDQIVMLAAMRGIPTDRGTDIKRRQAATLAVAGKGAEVLGGKVSLLSVHNKHLRSIGALPPRAYTPRPPRGPSTKPNIPVGHELAGVSTLTGPDGELKATWDKTRIHGSDEPPQAIPEHHHIKKQSVMQRPDGTTVVQWTSTAADEVAREHAMREAWARHAAMYAGLAAPTPAPTLAACAADMCTLYPLGDPHIGMLSWAPETGDHFDTRIACRELLACVRIMVEAAEPSERAIVCNLGDFMHAQDDANMTPGHGNKLDVDGRYAKVLDAGHVLLRGIVDAALVKHARVSVRNLPGNHDPRVAAELAMWLKAVYEREPRVTVEDPYAAQQYDRHGAVLIGWHHGDRAKPAELPAIMAVDRAKDWGECTERVWHTGHVHHLTRKESPGCVVESHRTMAGADGWHAGRYRAARSLCAIGYHKVFGEVSRATVNLARVRAALARHAGAA
jgi:hypothetical protein